MRAAPWESRRSPNALTPVIVTASQRRTLRTFRALGMAGARLPELFPMMPTMSNLTLVVAVLSYAGQLNLTAIADQDSARTWRRSPRAYAPPWTTSHDRCLRLPIDQNASSRLEQGSRA